MKLFLSFVLTLTVCSALIAAVPKKPVAPRTEQSPVTPAVQNRERHERYLKQAEAGKCDLLFLGDSITNNWTRARGGGETWAKFAKFNPLDFGMSGDRTEHVLWRITNGELDKIRPKVTVIMIGTNNLGECKDKVEWTAKGVKKIVETVREKLPDTKILLLAIFPRGDKGSEIRIMVDECNKIISKLDDGKTVKFLDINAKFLDADGNFLKDESGQSVMPDMLHPNAKGYQIWYDAMIPTLEEMMDMKRG